MSVGDVVQARRSAWTVDEAREGRVVASVDQTTTAGDSPGPFDEIELHAPAA